MGQVEDEEEKKDEKPKTESVTSWDWERINVQAAIWTKDTKGKFKLDSSSN